MLSRQLSHKSKWWRHASIALKEAKETNKQTVQEKEKNLQVYSLRSWRFLWVAHQKAGHESENE